MAPKLPPAKPVTTAALTAAAMMMLKGLGPDRSAAMANLHDGADDGVGEDRAEEARQPGVTGRIGEGERVVADVGVAIPSLRIVPLIYPQAGRGFREQANII